MQRGKKTFIKHFFSESCKSWTRNWKQANHGYKHAEIPKKYLRSFFLFSSTFSRDVFGAARTGFDFFCRSAEKLSCKKEKEMSKRSDFRVTSEHENCSRLISFYDVTATDIFLSFFHSRMLISGLDCSYTKNASVMTWCYRPQIEFSLKLNERLLPLSPKNSLASKADYKGHRWLIRVHWFTNRTSLSSYGVGWA